MTALCIAAIAIVFVLLFIFTVSYICFYLAFYVNRKKQADSEEYSIPDGEIYVPYRDMMIGWMKAARSLPCREYSITSFDGLKLYGKYYECIPGAPMEIMFHGYRGNAERDLCGGIQRCFSLGRNVLIVDQRTSAKSEGNVITFGINESRDCLDWINFAISEFGKDVKIIITGISMGATTVMIAAGEELPPNVIGALADCGFSSAKKIIKKVIRQMHLPAEILYPFVKLGAKLYGKFDLEKTSAVECMKKCKIPIIFFHGDNDDFVPCEMSDECYEACIAPKKLIKVKGAGHGLAYIVEPERYLDSLREFFEKYI